MAKDASVETLGNTDTPSAVFILKWLGILIGVAALTLVVVGLFLPREWEVEASVDVEASPAQIHALVEDVEQWERWMFDPEQAEVDLHVDAEGRGVGATVRWKGGGSRGEMVLVETDPTVGIAWDGKIETDEVNNHGEIRYEDLGGGVTRVTLHDTGELPRVFGGYFVPAMNSGLSQHFEGALVRLSEAAEADALAAAER